MEQQHEAQLVDAARRWSFRCFFVQISVLLVSAIVDLSLFVFLDDAALRHSGLDLTLAFFGLLVVPAILFISSLLGAMLGAFAAQRAERRERAWLPFLLSALSFTLIAGCLLALRFQMMGPQ